MPAPLTTIQRVLAAAGGSSHDGRMLTPLPLWRS